MPSSARLGYVINGSATSLASWSGLNVSILGALRQNGAEVVVADNLTGAVPLVPRLRRIAHRLAGQRYLLERDTSVVRAWAGAGARVLAQAGDVGTVVLTGAIPGVELPARYDLAIWADATFHALRRTYPGHDRLAPASIRSGDTLERRAFERARVVCFASEWAADDAVRVYGVDAGKVHVVPFGAICDAAYANDADAAAAIGSRGREALHLVFSGVDWHRKGGSLVLETAALLHRDGIPVRVTIAGCTPPADVRLPAYVEVAGFLDKQDAGQFAQWDRLMRRAHLLFVPSRADCFGLVYAEASAYAVPSVASDVGGVASAVRAERNGVLLPSTALASQYAAAIAELWHDRRAYERLALASFIEWQSRLNWGVAGRTFLDLLAPSDQASRIRK